MKMYQVFLQDEWNNNYLLGFFKNLDDCIPAVNDYLKGYGDGTHLLKPGDISEYPSTFGSVFDTGMYDVFSDADGEFAEEVCGLYVRGFILDSDSVKSEVAKLEAEDGE